MKIETNAVNISNLHALPSIGSDIYTKLEYLHPSGSMKHRSIPPFIEQLIADKELRQGERIAIRSAGAAAVTLAWIGAQVDCPVTAVLPKTVMGATIAALDWLGAEHHVVSPEEATQLLGDYEDDPDTYVFAQAGESRLIDHYRPVAVEIVEALGEPGAITVGIGTGLSVTGIAREISERGLRTQVWGVEPAEAAIASGEPWAPHRIPGLAPPISQPLLATDLLAGIVPVASVEAWRMAKHVARTSGHMIGPSSGATVAAASELALRGVDGPIVAISACAMAEYWEGVIDDEV